MVAGRRVWWRYPRQPSSSWARWGSGSRTPPSVRGLGAHTCLPSREGNWNNNNHSDRCQFIKPSCVKVMFSVVSVHQSVIPSIGVRCDHHPWCTRSHYAGTPPGAWDLTVQNLPPVSDIWWLRLETCSNLFTWGTLPPPTCRCLWWLLKHYDQRKRAVRILLDCFLVRIKNRLWLFTIHNVTIDSVELWRRRLALRVNRP